MDPFAVRNQSFFFQYCVVCSPAVSLNSDVLSRQAPDKHKKTVEKRRFFLSQDPVGGTGVRGDAMSKSIEAVRKTPSFTPFDTKNDHLTKTGSGQTSGKHSKKEMMRFCAGRVAG